ncbi:MAG TPA: hypothetical protein VF691_17825 [Cytophagaceae bacterium]
MKSLSVLLGEWKTVGKHPYLADMVLHGTTSFKWLEGGAFLIMHAKNTEGKIPGSVAVFGTDDTRAEIFMLYFDEGKVSRKYEVAFDGNVLTWWRNDSDFSQRFTLTLNDPNTMTGHGEMCKDGTTWEKDLELTYTRIN